MEDRDFEFGVVAVFLIVACVMGTILANNHGNIHEQHCVAVCDSVAMDVLVTRDDSCVCGGSGPVRELPLHRDAGLDAGRDAGRDAGPDSGADSGADSGRDAGPDAGNQP